MKNMNIDDIIQKLERMGFVVTASEYPDSYNQWSCSFNYNGKEIIVTAQEHFGQIDPPLWEYGEYPPPSPVIPTVEALMKELNAKYFET